MHIIFEICKDIAAIAGGVSSVIKFYNEVIKKKRNAKKVQTNKKTHKP